MLNRKINLSKSIELNESSARNYLPTEYKFRVISVPPEKAIKLIQVDLNHSISEVKKSIKRELSEVDKED